MICSFCATQLPADALYCAECGRPAMSRRARRSADAAPKKSQSARSKRAEKKAQPAASRSARRSRKDEATEAASSAITSSAGDEAHHSVEHAHAVSAPNFQLGDPLVLSNTDGDSRPATQAVGPVKPVGPIKPVGADGVVPQVGGDFPTNLGEDAVTFPYDGDGPYDEVSDLALLSREARAVPQPAEAEALSVTDESWRDLPAPNRQEIAWPNSAATLASESTTAEHADADYATAATDADDDAGADDARDDDAGAEIEDDIEPEPESESEALVEPEPLVEPSPLPRSPFEPDLSKVGRPEAVAPVQERSTVKSVRTLGGEPVFTTADRLRASAFAPVASERVSDQPAGRTTTGDAESDVASKSGTAPRVSEIFGTQLHDAVTRRTDVPDENDATASEEAALHTPSETSASTEALCAQCGESLSESDIFCGSCGFVRHGVGPAARTVSAPVLDPFPWGTLSVRATVVEEVPESNSAAQDENATSDEPAELAEQVEYGESDQGSEHGVHSAQESGAPIRSAVADDDATPIEGSAAAAASAPVGLSDPIVASVPAPARRDDLNETEVEFEQLRGAPRPADSGEQLAADVAQAPATNEEAAPTSGLSALAPPPMSHHRVELPIAPPAPLVSLVSDDEDIEDTRIAERSISGTRFVLQFSTGDSVIVSGTGLVGRNPISEPSEKFDILVPITDPSKSVSKTHLEFGQMVGAFWISDRYSGNGTVVREPDGEPKRCEPGKRYRVMRGTRVEIGEQFFIVS